MCVYIYICQTVTVTTVTTTRYRYRIGLLGALAKAVEHVYRHERDGNVVWLELTLFTDIPVYSESTLASVTDSVYYTCLFIATSTAINTRPVRRRLRLACRSTCLGVKRLFPFPSVSCETGAPSPPVSASVFRDSVFCFSSSCPRPLDTRGYRPYLAIGRTLTFWSRLPRPFAWLLSHVVS